MQDGLPAPIVAEQRGIGRTVSRRRSLRRRGVGLLARYVALTFGALLMIFPFAWMISTSFKTRGETTAFPPTFLPASPTIENYLGVFERLPIVRLYGNTAFLSITQTVLMIYTSALLGYVFAKFHFRGREALFVLLLSTMIIPFEVYMVPLYIMMVDARLGNSYWAIVLPSLYSAYAMFLFRQFMLNIPTDLLDAARIDGAGELYIFHRLVLPLSTAVLATLSAFYFMWNWNDFLWPLIVLSDSTKFVLPVALATLVGENLREYGLLMAGASIAIVPVLVVFVALQRYLIEGIAISGFK